MTKYLYGASIQGIQGFIFQTNKLKEIVGGSELVEEVCKHLLKDEFEIDENFPGIIQAAAGNVKIVFSEEEKHLLDKIVLQFPRKAMKKAPGITISQAVTELEGKRDFKACIDDLEEKLKVQRSKPSNPLEIGFMGLARDRRTGGVGIWLDPNSKRHLNLDREEVMSSSTCAKLKKFNEESNYKHNTLVGKTVPHEMMGENKPQLIKDLNQLPEGHKNNWIAVVHVDGNGLGKLIQELSAKLQERKEEVEVTRHAFQEFSQALENATQEAAKETFKEVFADFKKTTIYPFRPIICGGDDLTVIIRADLALKYTRLFIKNFQGKSAKHLKFLEDEFQISTFKNGLTACAGISFVKKSYPLHYAMDLAESLTKEAKKMVKDNEAQKTTTGLPKSSIAFYKVQESFIADLADLKSRTLLAKDHLDYFGGPYLLDQLNDKILEPLQVIKNEADSKTSKSKAVGKLRSIISETFENLNGSLFSLERMKEVNGEFYSKLSLDTLKEAIEGANSGKTKKSPLFDLISLHSFNYGQDDEN